MNISAKGLALLKACEGFRSFVYIDEAGFPTIGFGHKLLPGEKFPKGITLFQAYALLESDVKATEIVVLHLVKVPLTQGQFDALVDFTYNLGSGRLKSSTLLTLLNNKEYEPAAEQLLRWDHSGSRVVAQLEARRKSEYDLWNSAA